jgi:hypothetical protein
MGSAVPRVGILCLVWLYLRKGIPTGENKMNVPVGAMLRSIPDLFGIHSGEQPGYRILTQDGDFEIRHYEPLLIAKTFVYGDYRTSVNVGFHRLADYILGNNTSRAETGEGFTFGGEKIDMVAPVFQQKQHMGWEMRFALPESHSLSTLPIPHHPQIKLEYLDERDVAVIRYSGGTSEDIIDQKAAELMEWLRLQASFRPAGNPVAAQYDPPFTIPFLKRNEVMVRVMAV